MEQEKYKALLHFRDAVSNLSKLLYIWFLIKYWKTSKIQQKILSPHGTWFHNSYTLHTIPQNYFLTHFHSVKIITDSLDFKQKAAREGGGVGREESMKNLTLDFFFSGF